MRGPDQPPKPTGDPDPRSRPAIQTDPDLTIQTYDPVSWILEKFGHPVPDRSRPVPDQFHGIHRQCPFTGMLPKKKKQVCASSAESFDSF